MSNPDIPTDFAAAQAQGLSQDERLEALAVRSARNESHKVWIERLPAATSLGYATPPAEPGPLAGLTFAIKDNIDLAGVPTTAACPDFAYTPDRSATVVQRLMQAGALPLGKTNLDQFATGLVGVRSPYGECRNAIDPQRISGGSSAGSAVAVALGEADFALGTDTAGSGRIPAAFQGLVGLKPSRGLFPNTGVVPACRSLDCVTTMTRTVADAALLLTVMAGPDGLDPACRQLPPRFFPNPPRVGVPDTNRLGFADPAWGPAQFDQARARLEAIGCTVVPIDVAPFVEAGALLYDGPWVAERAVVVGAFIAANPESVHPVTRRIIDGALSFDAQAAFRGFDALRTLAAKAAAVFETVDAVMVPTADRFPTVAEVLEDPIAINTALGRFTNFMNLLDYAAIAVPAAVTEAGLPFGVTLFAGAGTDTALLELAAQFTGETWSAARGYPLLLAGAHMDGLPLNHQVRSRGGRLLRRCRTAPGYRIFALPGGPPERPALVADSSSDASIEVELWDLPPETVGSFLAGIPAPLGLGKVQLDDGSEVVGFIGAAGCEQGARDVTVHGGWRGWLAAREAGT
ncbi:MAG: allophanate hydrolase [Pseudomonadota bacterium]